MRIRPVADPEMVKQIHYSVRNPDLRSLLLKIIQDQRITENDWDQLKSHLTGQRSRNTQPKLRNWLKTALKR